MTDIPAIQKEIKLHEAILKVKESRINNSKEVGKLNEKGKVLEEEERVLKLRIEEHCGLVEGAKDEGRRLEEEEKGLQVELDLLNRPALIDCQSQPDSQVGQSLLVKQLKPIFPTEIFVCIAPHLPAKDQLCLSRLNKKIRNAIPKLLRLNFKYFKDSIDRLLTGLTEHKLFSQIPVHFTLDPKEVEMNPYGVIEIVQSIFEGDYSHGNQFPAIHALLGLSLKIAVPVVVRQNPKFISLVIAAMGDCPAAVQYLLESSDAQKLSESDFVDALFAASRAGLDEVLKILLHHPRIDPAIHNNFSLRLASREGHRSTIMLLLQDPRVSPKADDNFCLRSSVKHGYTDIVKFLLEDPRVNWKAMNFEALRTAHENGREDVLKLLLDRFVEAPTKGRGEEDLD